MASEPDKWPHWTRQLEAARREGYIAGLMDAVMEASFFTTTAAGRIVHERLQGRLDRARKETT